MSKSWRKEVKAAMRGSRAAGKHGSERRYWITDEHGNHIREITEADYRILTAGGRLPAWRDTQPKDGES